MSMRKRLLSVLSSFLLLLIVFLNISADLTVYAYDLPTGCELVSRSDMSSMLGETLSGQYLAEDGGEIAYKSCTFTYYGGTQHIYTVNCGNNLVSRPVVAYRCLASDLLDIVDSVSLSPMFQVDAYLNLEDVEYIDFGYFSPVDWDVISLYSPSYVSQYFYGDYNFNNSYFTDLVPLTNADDSSAIGYATFSSSASNKSVGCQKQFSFSGGTNIDFGTFSFTNARVSSNYYYIYILCPIISSGWHWVGNDPPVSGSGGSSSSVTGSLTGTVGEDSVDINVNVEVEQPDLTEDGPLSWLGAKIDALVSAIGNLFIPSDEAMQEFSDDIADEFDERLGGISELDELLDEQFDYIYDAVSVDTIYLGEIHAPVQFSGGSPVQYFDFGGYHVELRPHYQDLHVLYDAAAYMFDITALLMVLNMLKTKHEILLNPEGECIHYDN